MMRSLALACALAFAVPLLASACSDPAPTHAACPNDLPSACPADPPSYARDIAPLIQARCLECHAPGGKESNRDLTTYDHVYANRSAVLNQVYGCAMPPAGASGLDDAQRATLLAWLVCHAPNN